MSAALQSEKAPPRVIKLALAGCGVVGSELLRTMTRESDAIAEQHGVRFEVTRVLIRDAQRERDVPEARHLFTNDLATFLETPADIVVEAIGGLDPALRIAKTAIDGGKRFVTANKALIAAHGTTLHGSGGSRGAQLQFEAAVGGSIPIIRVLRETLGTAQPRLIRGILNGTSNYVLTLVERGVPLAAAIADAQQRGLAERDPSRDLDGRDSQDKISILAWLAHGIRPERIRVERHGLLPHIERIVADAAALDARVRLIAECALTPEGVITTVAPVIVAPDSAYGRTTHENNLVTLDFQWRSPVELAGPGAGGLPTASAILGDLLSAGDPLTVPSNPPTCIEDKRTHSWSVSVTRHERKTSAAFEAAGISTRCVQLRQNACCFLTAPVSRTTIDDLLDDLSALGAEPVATRVSL